jgi:hypothetical protein
MNEENAITLLRRLLKEAPLNDLEEAVFRFSWRGWSYSQISKCLGYDHGYIRGVGFHLWRSLTDECGQRVSKKNVRSVFEQKQYYLQESTPADHTISTNRLQHSGTWNDFPNLQELYGREEELATLHHWIVNDGSRLIGLFGPGGIGKTEIAKDLVQNLTDHFDCIIWRSLRNAPALPELLESILNLFSETPIDKQATRYETGKDEIDQFIDGLKQQRCLLVLDQVEAILQSGEYCGYFARGYQSYGELLKHIGEQTHPSCVILTSREKPLEFSQMQGNTLPVRSMTLSGLCPEAGRAIVELKGTFSATDEVWHKLVDLYCGNPLMLKTAGAAIQEMFEGKVESFLTHSVFIFDDINLLLDEQFNRLTTIELVLMDWLATQRSTVTLDTLEVALNTDKTLQSIPKRQVFEALKSLLRRALVYKAGSNFSQHPLIMEYLRENSPLQPE